MLAFYLSIIDSDEDRNKFEQLYITYKQDMYAVAYRILNNKCDAEDAVHDAFIRVAKNVEKISKIKCPEIRAFMVIIIKNTSIDIYNKNKKSSENTCILDDCHEIQTDDNITKEIDYQNLVDSIKSLPDTLKDVLYIRTLLVTPQKILPIC